MIFPNAGSQKCISQPGKDPCLWSDFLASSLQSSYWWSLSMFLWEAKMKNTSKSAASGKNAITTAIKTISHNFPTRPTRTANQRKKRWISSLKGITTAISTSTTSLLQTLIFMILAMDIWRTMIITKSWVIKRIDRRGSTPASHTAKTEMTPDSLEMRGKTALSWTILKETKCCAWCLKQNVNMQLREMNYLSQEVGINLSPRRA